MDDLQDDPSPNSLSANKDTYRASGLKRTLHGTIYQLKVLMLFAYRAYHFKYEDFKLATEMNRAEKFDDVVLEYTRERRICVLYKLSTRKISIKIKFQKII